MQGLPVPTLMDRILLKYETDNSGLTLSSQVPHGGLEVPPRKPCPTHLIQPVSPPESTRHTLAL